MNMMEKFLQMTRSTLQTYTGEETLTHDAMITKLRKIKTKKHLHDDDVDDIVDDDDEETLTRAKFNSENEDANENEEENDDESRDKKEAIIDGSK